MQYVLITEGSDDKMLSSPIEWLLEQHCSVPFSGEWANPSALDDASRTLEIRFLQVLKFYPADIYFIHRDTDTFSRGDRVREINDAAVNSGLNVPYVCVVPVRMTEAWFLFSEDAIRCAADRSRGRVQLTLPAHAEVQRRADPKVIMEEKLVIASELSGRKLKQFRADMARRKSLIATGISDYSPLRAHEAFRLFEAELIAVLKAANWA